MALAEFRQPQHAAGWGLVQRLRRRIADFLSGEHAATKRMAGTAFAIRIVSAGVIFASQALLARWIGSHEFGTYIYVWTWLLLGGDLVHLGLPLTAQRFVPEYTEARSDDLLRGYLTGSQWLTFATSSAVAGIAAFGVWVFQNAFDRHLIAPLYLACVGLPAYALTFMADGLARSYNWINLALLPAYLVRPLLLIATVAALRAFGVNLDATAVMGVLVMAAWFAVGLQMLQLNRNLKSVAATGPKRYAPKQWLTVALPVVFVWGLYTLLTSTDILVLKQFRPADDVAHYYAAAKTLGLVGIIYFAVAATTAHRFAAYHAAGNSAELAAFAASTVRWVFWLSLALTVLLLVAGRPLLMLFGADFVSGYPVMTILAVGQLARASIGPAERVLNVLGQQRKCAYAYVAALVFNISVCVLLAPAYGAIGAASATSGAFLVESILLFMIAKRGLGLHMFVWNPKGRAAEDHQLVKVN
jgi:O-antigen/teichoic acid export membrane protein